MRIRSFLALNCSIAVTRRIADEVAVRKSPLRVAGLEVAWVPAANYHLTLKFLGPVEEEAFAAVSSVVTRSITGKPPLMLRAAGLSAFPEPTQPKILWAGLDGGEPLLALQRELEQGLHALGFAQEERPFHPHITVGRVKNDPVQFEAAQWNSDKEFGLSTVSEIVLYESRTYQSGAEYVVLRRYSFAESTAHTLHP